MYDSKPPTKDRDSYWYLGLFAATVEMLMTHKFEMSIETANELEKDN